MRTVGSSQTRQEEGNLRRLGVSGEADEGTGNGRLEVVGIPGPSLSGVDLGVFELAIRLFEAGCLLAKLLDGKAAEGVFLLYAVENPLVGGNGGIAGGRESRVHS